MTPEQHQQIFVTFVKNSGVLNLVYSDTPIEEQKIIGVVDKAKVDGKLDFIRQKQKEGFAVIDPNWDDLYTSFISLDFNKEHIEYIKEIIKEDPSAVIQCIIKDLINSNIDSKEVYVIVSESWDNDWLDEIIEV